MARIALRATDLNFDGIDDRMSGGVHDDVARLVLLQQSIGHAHLAGDYDAVGGGQRLAGDAYLPRIHAGLLGLAINQIDDLVGDAVADLVGVSLGYGFRSEEIVLPRHGCPLSKRLAGGRPASGGTRVNEAAPDSSSSVWPRGATVRELFFYVRPGLQGYADQNTAAGMTLPRESPPAPDRFISPWNR